MFMLFLYLILVTLAYAVFPAWPTVATFLVPLAVVALARLALALSARKAKTPGSESTTGGQG